MRCALVLCWLLLSAAIFAQESIFGRWVTIDDNTGKRRSTVEITERGGLAYGRILQLFREPGEESDPICDECDKADDRHNKKVIGLEFIRNMKRVPGSSPGEWKDGTILDPENGSEYDCKLWVEGEKLKVRGYVAFFYRTQTWVRE